VCPQPHAAEAPGCTQRLAEYDQRHAKPHERTARFVEREGMEKIREDVVAMMPYVGIG
jgi:dissimilatory sulfite reductase (desulfoviridin) alpha/beta subunit